MSTSTNVSAHHQTIFRKNTDSERPKLMKYTAAQIAAILEGDVVGDPNATVSKLSKIEEGTSGSLTFLSNPKYNNYIYTTQATITIVNASFTPEGPLTTTLIQVEDAYLAFTKLLQFYDTFLFDFFVKHLFYIYKKESGQRNNKTKQYI